MKQCIYCLRSEPAITFTKEHVLPQGLGKFDQSAPVLRSGVCGDCNQYFGDELDIALTRDSVEGVHRYNRGHRSKSSHRQKRVTMEIADPELLPDVPRLRVYADGTTGRVRHISTIRLKNQKTGKEAVLKIDEMESFDFTPWQKDTNVTVSAGTTKEVKQIVHVLEKRGFKFEKPIKTQTLKSHMKGKEGKKVAVEVTGIIDETIKRAIAKIAFNFVAHYLGEAVVLGKEWDAAREYIRHGKGDLHFKLSGGPFWSGETAHMRFEPEGHSIRIENHNGSVMGYVQFFDMVTYEIGLAKAFELPESQLTGYRFPIGKRPLRMGSWKPSFPFYIAQFEVNPQAIVKLRVTKYGPS